MVYAVRKGTVPGVYNTWDECSAQVKGFKGAEYKKFNSDEEASLWMAEATEVITIDDSTSFIPGTVLCYVDGSYEEKENRGGWAAILVSDGRTIADISGVTTKSLEHRNVSGELEAAEEGIKLAVAFGFPKVIVCYDYTGIEMWANGSWEAKKAVTQSYAKEIKSLRDKIDIAFCKIKAHSGDIHNEMADFMANISLYCDKTDILVYDDNDKPCAVESMNDIKPLRHLAPTFGAEDNGG